MKKLIATLVLFFSLSGANAQSETYGKTLNLGLGLGYGYYYYGTGVPILANYEFDVAKNVTVAPFIGFYTLFWLGLSLFTIRTFLVSYRTTGRLFGHNIISILKKDVIVLGFFDAFMFASTFLCVPLQQAIYRRWITWNGWGWILQHVAPITNNKTNN